jgi:2-polyprenyl-6-methoxyphenol hydroxylase-like FAD-dependent oxidoreductase
VIGGGPGGAATAISCAQRGMKVVLLELSKFPRERPGETLHPGAEPILRQLGVWEDIVAAKPLRHRGHWVSWGEVRHFAPFGRDERGEWLGLQIWRADFDQMLLNQAVALGVRVLQPCRATALLVEHGRVVGVRAGSEELRARFTVDAAGGRHWLASQLKLEVNLLSPKLTAYYGYGEGQCDAQHNLPSITGSSTGWTWTARVRPGLYQWTRLTFDPQIRDGSPPAEFVRLSPRGKVRGSDVTWRVIKEAAGAGYFLVGDAAAVLDPTASHGVLKALMTGIMVAQAVGRIVFEGEPEDQVVAAYRRWIAIWFQFDLERLSDLYEQLRPRTRALVS